MILTLCSDVRLMKGKNVKFNYVVKIATGNSHKKNFYFYGCGWCSSAVNWSKEDELWISPMNKLFESVFGKDKVQYKFLQVKGTSVLDSDHPRLMFVCDHNTWEAKYKIFSYSVDTKSSSAAKSLKPQMDFYSLLPPCDESGRGSESENDANCGIVQIENSRFLPVNRAHTSVPAPFTFSSAKSVTINSTSVIDLTDGNPPGTLSRGIDAWLRSISTLTRKEVGNINVLQVSVTASHASHVISEFGAAYNETDPCCYMKDPLKGW